MKLVKFAVRNFRSIESSGIIDTDLVTAFVGVNESGKSNLLLPLWKFNPAKEGAIEPTSDYPKKIYQAIRANPSLYNFVELTFDVGEDNANEFAELTGFEASKLRTVNLTKRYDDQFTWTFPDAKGANKLTGDIVLPLLSEFQTVIETAKEETDEPGLKPQITNWIADLKKLLPFTVDQLEDRINQLK